MAHTNPSSMNTPLLAHAEMSSSDKGRISPILIPASKFTSGNTSVGVAAADMPALSPKDDLELAVKTIIGTTATDSRSFDISRSFIAYTAGAGAIVGRLRSATDDSESGDGIVPRARSAILSTRFFCTSTKLVQNLASRSISSSPIRASVLEDLEVDAFQFIRPGSSGLGIAVVNNSSNTIEDTSPSVKGPKDKMKTTSAVALSTDARLLAVGESGHQPRIFIYSLAQDSNRRPLAIISEHRFGIKALAFSPCGRFLVSLGTSNDGFLHVWQLNLKEGSVCLHSSNKCISQINDLKWISSNILVTLGIRHVRVWKIDTAYKRGSQGSVCVLVGKNAILGSFSDSAFTSAATVGDNLAVLATEAGELATLQCDGDDSAGNAISQPIFTPRQALGFSVACVDFDAQNYMIWASGERVQSVPLQTFLGQQMTKPAVKKVASADILDYRAMYATGKGQVVVLDKKSEIHSLECAEISDKGNADDSVGDDSGHRFDLDITLCQSHAGTLNGLRKIRENEILTWSSDGTVRAWDYESARELFNYRDPSLGDAELTVSCSCKWDGSNFKNFITGDSYGKVRFYEQQGKEPVSCVHEFQSHIGRVTDFDYCSLGDYELAASCSRDRTIQIFIKQKGGKWGLLQTLLDSHKGTIQRLRFACNGTRLVSCSADRIVQLYRTVYKDSENVPVGFISLRAISLRCAPSDLVVDESKKQFIVAADRQIYVYKLENGDLDRSYRVFDEDSAQLTNICLGSVSGSVYLAGVGSDKCLRLYDHISGHSIASGWGHSIGVSGIAWAASQGIVTSGLDGCIFFWKIQERIASHGFNISTSPGLVGSPTRKILSKAELAKFLPTSRLSPGARSPIAKAIVPSVGSPSTPSTKKSPTNPNTPIINTPTLQSRASGRVMRKGVGISGRVSSPTRDESTGPNLVIDIAQKLQAFRMKYCIKDSFETTDSSALNLLKGELRATLDVLESDSTERAVSEFGNRLVDMVKAQLNRKNEFDESS